MLRTSNQSGLPSSPRLVIANTDTDDGAKPHSYNPRSASITQLTCPSLQALEGKDVKDLLLNVGSGGGAAPAAGGAAPAAGGAAAAEAPKEEEKEEEKEESDEDMGFGLFD